MTTTYDIQFVYLISYSLEQKVIGLKTKNHDVHFSIYIVRLIICQHGPLHLLTCRDRVPQGEATYFISWSTNTLTHRLS